MVSDYMMADEAYDVRGFGDDYGDPGDFENSGSDVGWEPDDDQGVDGEEWDGKFSREHLKVERLYYEQPTGMYFFTPDGVGCIWYETREEAMADTDAFGQPIITLCQELSDF